MKLKNVAVVTAFVSLIGAAAHAGTVTVLGTDDIFAAGLLAPPLSTDGGGTLPSFYSVAPGQTLDITATGSVSCCLGSSTGPTGPDGFASNPFGSGSAITNSTGSTVSSFTGSGAFPLVATFFGALLERSAVFSRWDRLTLGLLFPSPLRKSILACLTGAVLVARLGIMAITPVRSPSIFRLCPNPVFGS